MLPISAFGGKPSKRQSRTNFFHHPGELFRVAAHLGFFVSLDHDPHQRLGAGLAQQHPAAAAHGIGDPLAGLLHRGMTDRVLTTVEANIDQYLRALAQAVPGLGQGLTATLEGQQHLQRGDDRVAGGGVLGAYDVAGILAPNGQPRSAMSAIT